MREIKFRGRTNEFSSPSWVYGDLICDCTDEPRIMTDYHDCYEPVTWTVDPATVGQFTGMRDCNGEEIYEGDILLDPDGEILTVFWNNGASSWECAGQVHHFLFIMRYIDMMQVIGNIHDNPQLLKEGGGNA